MKTKRMPNKNKKNETVGPACGPWIHPHMKNYTGYCFYKLAMRFRAMVDEELQEFQVLAPQFGILKMLSEVGSMTQVELGNYMAIDKATMVRFIDGLEKNGYLVRKNVEGDRRAKLLEITKAGLKASEQMHEARQRAEKNFLSPLAASERTTFKEILMKLADGTFVTPAK